MSETIHVRRAILHILDRDSGQAVLSDNELNIFNLEEYLEKHIERALGDDESRKLELEKYNSDALDEIKEFGQDNMKQPSELFVSMSRSLSNLFYNLVNNYDIPSADLLFVDYLDGSDVCLAVLKMNYRKGYIHHVSGGEKPINSIVCQSTVLPGESQKADEFLIFNFSQNTVLVKEKRYEIDGVREKYISMHILRIPVEQSPKEKLKAIKTAAKKVAEKYYPGDPQPEMEAVNVIYKAYRDDGELDLDYMGRQLSHGIDTMKEEFISEVRSRGVDEDQVELTPTLEKAIHQKHKLVTEDGVEVKLPVGFFERKDKFEIILNDDGTMSFLIKNVEIV